MKFSKNINSKKCAPKIIFFNEFFFQKDSDDFWHRKFTLKVQKWYFLKNCHQMETQNLVISFDYSWFLGKNLYNFIPPVWKLHNPYCHAKHFERECSLLYLSRITSCLHLLMIKQVVYRFYCLSLHIFVKSAWNLLPRLLWELK